MKLSLLLLPLLSLAAAADKRGVRVVKVTKTVDDYVTNTHVVEGSMSTVTSWDVETTTTTTTRYTSTYTSTIFGSIYTYVSVGDATIDIVAGQSTTRTSLEAQPETKQTQAETQETQAETPAETTQKTTQAETPAETTQKTTQAETQAETQATVAPTTTDLTSETEVVDSVTDVGSTVTSFPSVSGSWVLEDVSTSVASGSICIVDYDYYLEDYTETVTSTSIVYVTV